MVLLVPIASMILPCIAAFYIIRTGQRRLVIAILIALIAAVIWGIWKGQQYTGFDGLGYALFAMLMAVPAILGTLMGWITNRRKRAGLARRAAPD